MDRDAEVMRLAREQHAVVARRQLRALGVDARMQRRRVAAGRWEEPVAGVVRMPGAPCTAEQALMIAVLAAGPGAVASHEAAAWLWGLPGFGESIEVIRARGSYAGATGHRPRLVLPEHRTVVRAVPVTTLSRTIYDLAGVLPLGRTARLVDTVVARSPAMLPALHAMLPVLAKSGRPGITVMRTLLAERPVGTVVPASGDERRFERLMERSGIRGFERQVDVGGHSWIGRVDYRRIDIGLIVEVDSRVHHSSVSDVAADARRDAALLAAGWNRTLRFWDDDLWHRPWHVIDTLHATIAELERLAA